MKFRRERRIVLWPKWTREVANGTWQRCGQTSSGSGGSGGTQRHVEAGWQIGKLGVFSISLTAEASGGGVQAIYEGMDPRRSEGLGDEV